MPDKLVKYIECYVDTETCNLRCHYCYITQQRKFNNKISKLTHNAQEIREALSKKRLGGACLINICAGGETLIAKDILPVIRELLQEGHYIIIVTNGILSRRFDEICTWEQDLLKRLSFKFSFHYLELKEKNLLSIFFNNIEKTKQAGCSFTVEITPSDELIPHISELKALSEEKLGVLCHSTIARDDRTNGIDILSKMDFQQYQKTW